MNTMVWIRVKTVWNLPKLKWLQRRLQNKNLNFSKTYPEVPVERGSVVFCLGLCLDSVLCSFPFHLPLFEKQVISLGGGSKNNLCTISMPPNVASIQK